MMPDGKTLYVWFTPSPGIPVEKQLFDGVTGIYAFQKTDAGWSDAQRIWLQDPGKLALDGCEFVLGNTMWFCSAREGYTGMNWFTAEFVNGTWQNWKDANFNPAYEVGELHITADGKELYFHSPRAGGLGEYEARRNCGGRNGSTASGPCRRKCSRPLRARPRSTTKATSTSRTTFTKIT